MHHRIAFLLAVRLSVRWFQIPFEWLSFVIGIIYATEPFLQNMTKIVCLN